MGYATGMTISNSLKKAIRNSGVTVYRICKDTGIPQHASDTAALGIDVYVAGVLESVEAAARQEERARRVATDHQVWVAVASFAGSTGGYSQAAGRSAIWGPEGVLITQAGPETGAIAHATLL